MSLDSDETNNNGAFIHGLFMDLYKCQKEVLKGSRLNTFKQYEKHKSHKANMFLFVAKHPTSTVLHQINYYNSIESKRKRIWIVTFFHILFEEDQSLNH